jgi:hypothetical protein
MAIIQNYRRDISDKVISLSNYSPLQPIRDKNYDVAKLNERFIKLSNAIRIVFESVGDLVSADRSFIPTFLRGYVNPVKNISVKHENISIYRFSSGLDTNGVPITFSDSRIVYSFPEIFDIAIEEYEFKVFKNGYMANTNDYVLSNTASGVKVFYKEELVEDNDVITLAVDRIYSPKYKLFKYTHTDDTPTSTYKVTINVNDYFSYFQNVKYLRVAIRLAGETHYSVLDSSNYYIAYDAYNTLAEITLNNITLHKFDTLIVIDALTYFNKIINAANTTSSPIAPDDVELTYVDVNTNEKLPIAFSDINEFEVWINGYRLIPEKHFVIKTVSNTGDADLKYLSFLFKVNPNQTYQIYITKNSVYDVKSYTYLPSVDIKGVQVLDMGVISYENLGYTFVEGQMLDNKKVLTVHDNVIYLKSNIHDKDFYYYIFIPNNDAVNELLDSFKDSLSEADKVIIATGGINNFINNFKSTLADKVFSTTITPFQKLGAEAISNSQYLDDYLKRVFIKLQQRSLSTGQLADANSSKDDYSEVINSMNSPVDNLLWEVDANIIHNATIILDASNSEISINEIKY